MVAEHVERMQQRSEELNDKLSFGAYFSKQVRNLAVNLIGAGGGLGLGIGLSNMTKARTLTAETVETLKRIPFGESIAKSPNKWIGGAIGYTAGSLAAATILGYEHWAKGEAERLAVDEIGQDIAEAKLRMNPELMRENATLREMLADEQGKHAKSDHGPAGHEHSKQVHEHPKTPEHAEGKPTHARHEHGAMKSEAPAHDHSSPRHEVLAHAAKHEGSLREHAHDVEGHAHG